MDDRYEARNKLEAYLKSSVNKGDYIVKTTLDKALPSEIYKMIMDEINKKTQGEWLKLSNMSKRSYQRFCSNCHHISYFCGNGNYPFCPYCKAEMKSEEDTKI